ncbi:MAG: endonuclease/exonuclease/phosphatase family protein [Alistipes sp.]|nr:endonuclease/exonuclease/phosphatase family protein [Alistipes sp.]
MKNLMFWVAALTMVFFTSCQQEQTTVVENATVDFTITTPAISTRAAEQAVYGNGAAVNVLKYALFEAELDANNNVVSLIGEPQSGVKSNAFAEEGDAVQTETALVGIPAIKGKTYAILFWAEADGDPYTVDWAKQTVTINDAALLANNENLDAFFGVHTFTMTETAQQETAYLKRPFAQLNIATTDKSDAADAKVTVTETYVAVEAPRSLNILTGRTTAAETVAFESAAIPVDKYVDLDKDGKYDLISFNYIFVDTEKSLTDVTFKYKYNEGSDVMEYVFDKITLERNHRTYIVGSLLTEEVIFNVKINPVWEDSHIYHGDGTGSTPPEPVDVPEPAGVTTMNGYERVQLSWTAGEGVTKTVVSWGDSNVTEFEITRADDVTMTTMIEDLDEGDVTFTLTNYDKDGNASDPVEVQAKVYGQNWYSTLVTRPVKSVDFANGNATVTFEDTWANKADCSATTLTYTNKNSEAVSKQISNTATEIVCDNIAVGATISITSSYKPENYIPEDTKVSPAIEKVVEAFVTVKVLQWNVGNTIVGNDKMQAWSTRKASVASFINTEAPDIIFGEELIESSDFMAGMMSAIDPTFTTGDKSDYMLPGEGAKYKGYYGDRDDGGEGICCIYNKTRFEEVSCGRFWLWADPGNPGKLTLDGDSANNKRIAVWIRLRDKSTGKEFVVSSVHIDNSNTSDDQAKGFPIMTWQVNTYINNLQARSGANDDNLPVIMGGDFNCGPQHSVITNISNNPNYFYADTRIAARNLKKPISYPDSSLAETDAKSRSTMVSISRSGSFLTGYTYSCTQDIYAAFDYIFMKNCETLNFHKIHPVQVGDVVMSDHNPITTAIVMKF